MRRNSKSELKRHNILAQPTTRRTGFLPLCITSFYNANRGSTKRDRHIKIATMNSNETIFET